MASFLDSTGLSHFTQWIVSKLNGKANTSHNHTKSQINDFPTSLPANGGNADTVDGKHASAFALASHTHNYLPLTGGTLTGALTLSTGNDASGTAFNSPPLVISNENEQHLEFDANEIMSKADETTPGTLNINYDGGNVIIGNSSSTVSIRGKLVSNVSPVIKMGTATGTLPYVAGRTRAVIEMWKKLTISASDYATIYDSVLLTGLSSSMTARTPSAFSSGPDHAFVYGITATGGIIISGDFDKYRVTYYD